MVKIPGVPDSRDAIPGMAFFAGTGPKGTTCESCLFLGYMRKAEISGNWYKTEACEQFKLLTGRHGPRIAKNTRSCKYYKGAGKPK
jgi:hypothetical protein